MLDGFLDTVLFVGHFVPVAQLWYSIGYSPRLTLRPAYVVPQNRTAGANCTCQAVVFITERSLQIKCI